MTRVLRSLFVLVLAVASLTAHAEGSLVIVGGALRADNAVVWQRIVDLAGERAWKICSMTKPMARLLL